MSGEDLISSLYPPPPKFYEFFTSQNLQSLRRLQAALPTESQDLQGELKLLVPPQPPNSEYYRGYGNIWSFKDKLPTLKNANWQQLYEDDDEQITSTSKISELHKLVDSLLLCFLEVLGIMSIDPLQFEPKIKDMTLILVNINHLLNTYRPHQSRESLIMLLRAQIDKNRSEITEIDAVSSKIKQSIIQLSQQIDGLKTGNEDDMQVDSPENVSLEQERNQVLDLLLTQDSNAKNPT